MTARAGLRVDGETSLHKMNPLFDTQEAQTGTSLDFLGQKAFAVVGDVKAESHLSVLAGNCF
jgi:hypothetical protein